MHLMPPMCYLSMIYTVSLSFSMRSFMQIRSVDSDDTLDNLKSKCSAAMVTDDMKQHREAHTTAFGEILHPAKKCNLLTCVTTVMGNISEENATKLIQSFIETADIKPLPLAQAAETLAIKQKAPIEILMRVKYFDDK
eukprot:GHVT01075533.1.p1 GENE.GHVT01075533.1~~GHVT01075533.1.p1  ORF type:complete len:138 (-),score=15.02 GHVT01075533.1:1419-1832(-)